MQNENRVLPPDCRLPSFILEVVKSEGEFPCDKCLTNRELCHSPYGVNLSAENTVPSMRMEFKPFGIDRTYIQANIEVDINGDVFHVERIFKIHGHLSAMRNYFEWMYRALESAVKEKIK